MKLVTVIAIFAATRSQALTITGSPSFCKASNAPLAGVLNVTTDTGSQVSVSINDGVTTWEHDFFDYGTNHCLTLLGFKANRTNEIIVTVRDKYRSTFTFPEPLTFITSPLPTDMPTLVLVTNNLAEMEPGYTLFRVGNQTLGTAYVTIIDNSGEIVWYSGASAYAGWPGTIPTPSDIRQLTNGDLFYPTADGTGFAEANMLGQTVRTWTAP
ncbi:MAG TPA: hypothetical protein VGN61_07545 [Verrucomicrobiae bacterium]